MIKHNGFLLVTVPEGEHGYFIHNGYLYADERYKHVWYKKLPPGTYQLIGLAAELTEEQWRDIVEILYDPPGGPNMRVWKNYMLDKIECPGVNCLSAKESGRYLLRSHNLKPETTIVIKKIEK